MPRKKMISTEDLTEFFGEVSDPGERFAMLMRACINCPPQPMKPKKRENGDDLSRNPER